MGGAHKGPHKSATAPVMAPGMALPGCVGPWHRHTIPLVHSAPGSREAVSLTAARCTQE